jgi:transcriptional regulator with XRE-family HTH domain
MAKVKEEMTPEEEAGWAAMGRRLRVLREKRHWKQRDLAKAVGMSESNLRAIENRYGIGTRNSKKTLWDLSEKLGLPGDYLASCVENPPSDEEPDSEPGATRTAPPPRSTLDQVLLRINEIVADCLNEIVVPRLESVERRLVDIIPNTVPGVVIDGKHPRDAE